MKTMWLPAYATRSERLCRLAVVTFALTVLVFLIGPLFVVFPLSISKDPFFTFPIQEYSWRWYADFFENPRWTESLFNSLFAALLSTALATLFGTLAALGISRPGFPARKAVMALMISPMIMPVVIIAVGAYMFFGTLGLTNTRTGLVLAHAALSIPFVVVMCFQHFQPMIPISHERVLASVLVRSVSSFRSRCRSFYRESSPARCWPLQCPSTK
jgi:putative spermidine/putrescine transport system permease protein